MLFIHLPADGPLGCLHLLTLVNKTAVNVCNYFVDVRFHFSWACTRMELLGNMLLTLCLTAGGTALPLARGEALGRALAQARSVRKLSPA